MKIPSLARYAWAIPILSVAGAVVCTGQVLLWSSMGAWPFHDTADSWLAGHRLLVGEAVYVIDVNAFLNFIYGPPWAVLFAPISLVPLEVVEVVLFALQVLALRYVAGSWVAAGLFAWLPFVPRELVTGNVDLIMAAAILAAIRGVGWPVALFAFAKFSPALVLLGGNRRQWIEAIVTGAILVAITLPWFHLWGEWLTVLLAKPVGGSSWLPLVLRLPIVALLVALRRPWALAAAAGLLTPAFHFHSVVLLFPAVRLWFDAHALGSTGERGTFAEVTPVTGQAYP